MEFPTIKYIKSTNCPVCDAGIYKVELTEDPASHLLDEKVFFACGCIVEAFSSRETEQVNTSCPKAHELFLFLSTRKVEPPVVRWVVTEGNNPTVVDDGELGVSINGAVYLYYKWAEPSAAGSEVNVREVHKREFGEVIRRPKKE